MAKLRVIEVSGTTALERGTAYGRAAADLIGQALTYYAQAFELQTGRTWAELLALSEPWERLISTEYPEFFEEMTGIARGAQVPVREIVVLNCRGEIVYDAEVALAQWWPAATSGDRESLAVKAKVVVLDESVSALDVWVKAKILALLNDLRAAFAGTESTLF